ncbi:hypothetical protein B0O80DRAFT_496817 [Mortierella sp. GBAus27b]|nr:hypothetical protein B0O80DRAFT_496817 [Mortierella sp. GBAus27b]
MDVKHWRKELQHRHSEVIGAQNLFEDQQILLPMCILIPCAQELVVQQTASGVEAVADPVPRPRGVILLRRLREVHDYEGSEMDEGHGDMGRDVDLYWMNLACSCEPNYLIPSRAMILIESRSHLLHSFARDVCTNDLCPRRDIAKTRRPKIFMQHGIEDLDNSRANNGFGLGTSDEEWMGNQIKVTLGPNRQGSL